MEIYSTYLDVTEHFNQIVGAAAECEMVQYVLIHEFDIGVS